jgi:hypothetical protein
MNTFKQHLTEKQIKVDQLDVKVKTLKDIIAKSGNFDAVKAWNEFEIKNPKEEFFDKKHLRKASIIIKQYKVKVEKA